MIFMSKLPSIKLPDWAHRAAPILVFLTFAFGVAVVIYNMPSDTPLPPVNATDSDSSIIAIHEITEIEAASIVEKAKFDSLQNASNIKIKNHEREIERLKKLFINNWNLPADSSYDLSVMRLSQEPEYSKGFIY
jgi:hypothetical protein